MIMILSFIYLRPWFSTYQIQYLIFDNKCFVILPVLPLNEIQSEYIFTTISKTLTIVSSL